MKHVVSIIKKFIKLDSDLSDIHVILGPSIIAESINIYDLSGRIIEQININGKKELRVNVSSYSKGTYLMNIHSNNGTLSKILILGN